MLTGDADIDLVDFEVGHVGGLPDGVADGVGGEFDVEDDAALYALGVVAAVAEDVDFAVFGTLAYEAGYFGCADVKTYYDVALFLHGMNVFYFSSKF